MSGKAQYPYVHNIYLFLWTKTFYLTFTKTAMAKARDDTLEMDVELSETESALSQVILHKYLQKAYISSVIYIIFYIKIT